MELFEGRTLVVATMHQKERAIAPLMTQALKLNAIVPSNFDTDRFGTFTREIKRWGTQVEAARQKAKTALEITGESLAIASEGAFFPHPAFPYICCDREIVLLLDAINDLEIIAQEIATETNFAHQTIDSIDRALEFAQKIGFPEHALVVMFEENAQDKAEIFKGIASERRLSEVLEYVLHHSPTKTAHLETDMRAMHNPTRLQVIARATENLIQKIKQRCPQCSMPGFDIVERETGLPCSLCLAPTSLIKTEISICQKCQFKQTNDFPNNLRFADPTYCEYCNP